ncbi:MAG TPA: NAD-dependent epimerase/dehydratase family protein, partial [Acidimicrobiales bacterium]|nr:NAD-dependent epimerase/dehydratase family protein [Acidimicrobiales bacterium]
MNTVVVTGAAGAVGRRVVDILAGRPEVERVVAVDRVGVPGQRATPPKVERQVVDLARTAAPPWGADAVIHLAWETETAPRRRSSGAPAAAAGANLQALAAALHNASGARSLVHLSSATVYGAWPDNPVPISEDATIRPNPGFAYAWEKAEAERRVGEWAEAHPEAAVAVLRPCAVVGSTTAPLYRALGGLGGPQPEDRAGPLQYLHVDDLAAAVVLAWEQGLRGAFNVAPDRGTSEATARAIAGGLGRVPLPAPVARVATRLAWRVAGAGVPPEAEALVRYPWVVSADRLAAAGWRPRYTSEEALVAAD